MRLDREIMRAGAVMTATEIILLLDLKPLDPEGGFFTETYRGALIANSKRSAGTAIYYLLTPGTFSAMHRLPNDEIYHFYLGDPVEMLLLFPEGRGQQIRLGSNLSEGERPQIIVPAGVWQGAMIANGGSFALMGTTVAPGFEFRDYEPGDGESLARAYPALAGAIDKLTR